MLHHITAAVSSRGRGLTAILLQKSLQRTKMADNKLVDTWQIHDRINVYLLDAVDPGSLGSYSASKGRSVGEQFAHIHNVRLMWLKSAAPELLKGLAKIEKEQATDQKLLRKSLTDSGRAISSLLSKSLEADGKVKGFKPHAPAFLGYLISHESHHRGQIALTLKQAGKPVDKKVVYGLWEWGVR
jgi:uncharacterized damage-inducible protein DinB